MRTQINSPTGHEQLASLAVSSPITTEDTTWVLPMSNDAYHGLLGKIIRTIEPHTEADPAALTIQLLAGFGNLIGHRPHFLIEGARHTTNLFTVIVGQTAKARKGTSWGRITQVLGSVDKQWSEHCILDASPTGEGLIWHVRDPIWGFKNSTKQMVDPGADDKRLLLALGEFVTILKQASRPGSTISSVLRSAWDSGWMATLSKKQPAKASNAHVTLIAHITLEELRRYLNGTEIANGLANRILFVCARRSKHLPLGGQLNEKELIPLIEALRAAAKFAACVDGIGMDVEAEAHWCMEYTSLSRDRQGLVGAICARAEAQVIRLSTMYALLDQSKAITVPHLQAALAVWQYCERSAEYIFSHTTGSDNNLSDQILQALKNRPEGMSRTEIHSLFNHNKTAAEIADALLQLTIAGKVRVEKRTSTGGRPIEMIFAVLQP